MSDSTDRMDTGTARMDAGTARMDTGTDKLDAGTARMDGSQSTGQAGGGIVFAIGQTVVLNGNNCVIESLISMGSGEAVVYKIQIDGKPYALKHYKPKMDLSDTAKKLLTKIRDNPKDRIVKIFDFGRYSDQDFEIMEYAGGGTLGEYIKKNGAIRDTKLKDMVKQINEGLLQLHGYYKAIYQDLKPENIFFRDAQRSSLVLADFGISSVMQDGSEEVEVTASNTDLYGAPELARKGNNTIVIVTPAVDYFALGMTVYELWLGEQPFKEIKAIMRERHIQNNDVDFPVDMPDDCKTLIRGLLNYTPKDRMGNEHVQKWLKGETLTLNNKPVTVTGTVYEPLKIGNETASNPKEMSALMGKYPDMGKVCLYDDFITSNLKKAGDVTLYNEIKNVISQYGNDREAGLTAAMYTLDPERPFISRTGKPCTSGEEIADAITADSAHYMDDLKNPNAGLYIYITVTGGSQGKEVADIFRKYFKEYSPNRALTLVFLKLQSDGGMSIGSKRYLSADELAQENDSSQINLIIKAVCEKDSQLLVWLSDIYGDYFKSTEEFAKLSTPDQFFLLGLLPFLSFKELTGSNGEDALHDLIYNYLERADFFETYAGQGLPLKGQILDSPVKKTPIDYVVRNFNYLSGTYGSDTVCNLIRLLHKLAADVNEYSGDDTNPLINANLAKEKDLVNLLLELGADPNPYRKFIERQEEQERIERERIEEQDKYKTCIFASFDFTVALKTDGTVVAVGNNREGQCKTSGWRDIVAISVAENVHTVGLKADGTVVAVGYNKDGRCNTGGWRDIVAVSAGGNSTVGLKADGTVVVVGSNGSGQCNTGGWCDIVTVFAGGGVTVGLKADGTVVAVGSNEYGLCNVISGWRDIVAVSIGSYSSIVGLKADGTVVADGRNEYGECDTGGWRNIVAIFVTYHTVGLKADGTVVAVGNNREGQCKTGGWRDIVAISAGCSHTVGLKADGTVVAVGYNKDGQCNTSDWRDIIAVSAGDFHTVGLKADGTVVAVGVNYDGRCNTGDWRDIGPASKERQIRMKQGLCIHCGGQLGGLFTKKCKICGKVKP